MINMAMGPTSVRVKFSELIKGLQLLFIGLDLNCGPSWWISRDGLGEFSGDSLIESGF